MKIAFVIHHLNKWGGQERSTVEIINRFAAAHDVHVFAHSAEGLLSSVKFHKIPLLIKKPFFAKDFAFRLLVGARLAAGDFDVINATGNCCLQSNVITIQFCQKRWNRERRRLGQPLTPRKLLADFQSAYDVFWEKVVYRLRKNDWYIALSETVADDLRSFYRLKNVAVIPHGVNLNEFGPSSEERRKTRASLGVTDDELLLLFVGTFERKGLFFLLPAVARLASEKKIKLCVVGQGPVRKAKAAAARLGIEDLLIFTGHTRQVTPYYQAADIFILPSLYDPFGLVGIEALACGLPSVVSKQSGVSDLIKHGQNGLVLQEPWSEEEIYENLKKLAEDTRLREGMRREARPSVEKSSWDAVWPNYEKIFSLAAAQRREK